MKVLGLIGGISWVSTADYYRIINQGINDKLGGLNFSECIIYSFNFADIKKNNDKNDWESTYEMLKNASTHLKSSGASAIILCANTMHFLADRLEEEINIPVIHVATVTANKVVEAKLRKVALLGTKFTMELDFFKSKLREKNIETVIPKEEDRDFIQNSIYEELGKGVINPETKKKYLRIIEDLIQEGAEGVILGCTEIPLLIKNTDVDIPVFDTTIIHSQAAIEFAIS
jgi:aspartate racemase